MFFMTSAGMPTTGGAGVVATGTGGTCGKIGTGGGNSIV